MTVQDESSERVKEPTPLAQASQASTELDRVSPVTTALDQAGRGELWMGHFHQLTTLALGGGAGLLVLLEVGAAVQSGLPFYVSLVSFGVGLILCLGGQAKLLDDDGRDPALWRNLREIRRAVFLSLLVAFIAFLVALLS
jgi:hypothetical protein